MNCKYNSISHQINPVTSPRYIERSTQCTNKLSVNNNTHHTTPLTQTSMLQAIQTATSIIETELPANYYMPRPGAIGREYYCVDRVHGAIPRTPYQPRIHTHEKYAIQQLHTMNTSYHTDSLLPIMPSISPLPAVRKIYTSYLRRAIPNTDENANYNKAATTITNSVLYQPHNYISVIKRRNTVSIPLSDQLWKSSSNTPVYYTTVKITAT